MTLPIDDDRMMRLAAAVTDTTDVDWPAWEHDLGGAQDVVPGFKLLAAVGSVARCADPWPEQDPQFLDTTEPATWGRLRLEGIIGRGSFGTVYKAWDPVLEKHVALKLLHPRGDEDEAGTQRALDEARTLARVNHENVVRVFGVETHDGRVGLWMELIDGRTLEEILEQQGPRSADETSTIGAAVCRALAAVHAAGFVHQDLKPHNVMREDGGRIVLMDLGLGLRLSGARSWPPVVGGSPLYLAPQLFEGHVSSPLSDIYSVGVLLFHLVSGRYPVEGSDRIEIEKAHKQGRRHRLRDLRPSLPPHFVQVVERSLAKEPGERYQTAGDFEAALVRKTGDSGRSRVRFAVVTIAIAAALVALTVASFRNSQHAGSAIETTPAARVDVPVAVAGPYRIRASFSRKKPAGDERLNAGSRLALGDTLALNVDASAPVYAYVINQDDHGAAFLLYPLDDLAGVGPLPVGETRIPQHTVSEGWVVNSPGGREHFLVAVSRHRMMDFEREVQSLPRPQFGAPVGKPLPLSDQALGTLRSVGRLAPATPKREAPLSPFLGATELGLTEESADGLWLRRITFQNP